jgi:tellurite methyltransferase
MNRTVDFFSQQFERQISTADYRLNPFEEMALPFVRGRVLDLGCGLGNFSIAAARQGCDVTAVDACPNATADLQRRASRERLPIRVECRELAQWRAVARYDAVVAIGLLMFFPRTEAVALLCEVTQAVEPGGIAVLNVLIEGTSYTAMFEPARHCLFAPDELERSVASWMMLVDRVDEFPAPNDTVKRFSTVIARRPAGDAR